MESIYGACRQWRNHKFIVATVLMAAAIPTDQTGATVLHHLNWNPRVKASKSHRVSFQYPTSTFLTSDATSNVVTFLNSPKRDSQGSDRRCLRPFGKHNWRHSLLEIWVHSRMYKLSESSKNIFHWNFLRALALWGPKAVIRFGKNGKMNKWRYSTVHHNFVFNKARS